MSNVIYIVDLQANGIDEPATDLTQLWTQIQPLLDSGTPSPKYVEFAKALEQEAHRNVSDSVSLNAVRAGLDHPGDQARTLTTAAWAMALPSGSLGGLDEGQLLHLVVYEAMKLDLLVFADHLGVAFLPGGEVVSAPGSDVDWELLLEEPMPLEASTSKMTRLQMVERVVTLLDRKLKPHGFSQVQATPCKKDGTGGSFNFVREFAEGPQFIRLHTGSLRYEGLTVLFSIGGRNSLVHPLLWKAMPELEGEAELPYAADYRIHFPYTRVFKAWSSSELYPWPDRRIGFKFPVQPGDGLFAEEAVESLIDTLVNACVPILDAITDLRGIQRAFIHGSGQVVEAEIASTATHAFTAIAAAYLLSDPALDQFARDAISRVADDPEASERVKNAHTDAVERLLAYLRAEVEPLVR